MRKSKVILVQRTFIYLNYIRLMKMSPPSVLSYRYRREHHETVPGGRPRPASSYNTHNLPCRLNPQPNPHSAPAHRGSRPPSPRRQLPELAPRRRGQQHPKLDYGPSAMRRLRRPLHARPPVPRWLRSRHHRSHPVRQERRARPRRQGHLGIRHRRDHSLQPPLLRPLRRRLRVRATSAIPKIHLILSIQWDFGCMYIYTHIFCFMQGNKI